ncbi:hypothetical protein KW849_14315 [Pseudomonas sp. PDM26]|uniref:hypothetical protein n=1 Tax=Pseudomonas sp. PDM26 TaxID=2854766 RepID=UPI001C48F098|nr:hypothetical protein [Pseudomonas sp. PDM26]MBV7547462.1 hypothetical protein [Pseudomonas sp. PDM26]
MTFEAPQKGNPRRLTVNQHTFPSASIARFAGARGSVQVFHKRTQKVIPVKPKDQFFCAQRVWDQKAETGFMKGVEDAFQELAGEILSGKIHRFGASEAEVINEFYCLWNIRARHKQFRIADQSLADYGALAVAREYTKDEQEIMELEGIGCIRPDLTMASRLLVAPTIRLNLSDSVQMLRGALWQVLRAREGAGEFIVPDNFYKLWAVPLSPTVCLWAHSKETNKMLDRAALAVINRDAVETSLEYYFARDLSQCPR